GARSLTGTEVLLALVRGAGGSGPAGAAGGRLSATGLALVAAAVRERAHPGPRVPELHPQLLAEREVVALPVGYDGAQGASPAAHVLIVHATPCRLYGTRTTRPKACRLST